MMWLTLAAIAVLAAAQPSVHGDAPTAPHTHAHTQAHTHTHAHTHAHTHDRPPEHAQLHSHIGPPERADEAHADWRLSDSRPCTDTRSSLAASSAIIAGVCVEKELAAALTQFLGILTDQARAHTHAQTQGHADTQSEVPGEAHAHPGAAAGRPPSPMGVSADTVTDTAAAGAAAEAGSGGGASGGQDGSDGGGLLTYVHTLQSRIIRTHTRVCAAAHALVYGKAPDTAEFGESAGGGDSSDQFADVGAGQQTSGGRRVPAVQSCAHAQLQQHGISAERLIAMAEWYRIARHAAARAQAVAQTRRQADGESQIAGGERGSQTAMDDEQLVVQSLAADGVARILLEAGVAEPGVRLLQLLDAAHAQSRMQHQRLQQEPSAHAGEQQQVRAAAPQPQAPAAADPHEAMYSSPSGTPEYADVLAFFGGALPRDQLQFALAINGLIEGIPQPDGHTVEDLATGDVDDDVDAQAGTRTSAASLPMLCTNAAAEPESFGHFWPGKKLSCAQMQPGMVVEKLPPFLSQRMLQRVRRARQRELVAMRETACRKRAEPSVLDMQTTDACSVPQLPQPATSLRVLAQQEAIRRAFLHAWHAYEQFAFGTDTLKPHSRTGQNDLCKMAMTLVDSLDTLVLAGDVPSVERAVAWIAANLTVGGQVEINLFETTIRIVGGLVAAYDLLQDPTLLSRAEEVMRAMIDTGAFTSASKLPFGTITIKPMEASPAPQADSVQLPGPGATGARGHAFNPSWNGGLSSFSEVATLQLELVALSERTGNPEYAQYALDIMKRLAAITPSDGLFPMLLDPSSGMLRAATVTLGARGDSGYEYMLKQWIQAGGWAYERRRLRNIVPIALYTTLAARVAVAREQIALDVQQPHADADAIAQARSSIGRLDRLARWLAGVPSMRAVTAEGWRNMTDYAPLLHAFYDDEDPPMHVRGKDLADLAAEAQANSTVNPRFLLWMYNRAVCGIMDRLVHRSVPSGFVYIAEAATSADAMPGQDPALIPKMDHLVCFAPGMLGLGLAHGAGHEALAVRTEASLRERAVRAAAASFIALAQEDARRHRVTSVVEPSGSAQVALPALTFIDAVRDAYVLSERALNRHANMPSDEQHLPWDLRREDALLQDALAFDMFLGVHDFIASSNGTTRIQHYSVAPRRQGAKAFAAFPKPDLPQVPPSLKDLRENGFCSWTDTDQIASEIADIAHELTRTCYNMYARTSTGLAPEIVTFHDGRDFAPNHDARHCLLRPETVESLFIMHRLTGRQEYRDWAWDIFDSLERHARVRGGGYASVRDINAGPFDAVRFSAGRGNQDDKMESFMLAETLKYLYLTFSDDASREGNSSAVPSVLDLRAWVYNTEAHPLRVTR